MPKSIIKQKFKDLNANQQKECEIAVKQIGEKYKPLREDLYFQCEKNKHRWDNGISAIENGRCRICNKNINTGEIWF